MPKISVIIVNYNAGEWLSKCIDSVLRQSFKDFECFIVDNASTDGSRAWLQDYFSNNEHDSRLHLLNAQDNIGFAAANNWVAKQAKGDWLALLNPDAFAHEDWLEKLLEATQLKPNVTMVGSTQFMALDTDKFDGIGDEYHAFGLAYRAGFNQNVRPLNMRESFAPCGAAAFFQRQAFLKVGGFDETFFCYHEDVDLAYRLRLIGGICIQSSDAKIDHISSGISGRASEFAIYYGTRNRVWTFMKNTPLGLMPFLFPGHIAINFLMLIWAAFRSKRFGSTWKGLRDGFFTRPATQSPRIRRQISYWTLLRSFGWSPIKVKKRAPINNKTL